METDTCTAIHRYRESMASVQKYAFDKYLRENKPTPEEALKKANSIFTGGNQND